MNHYVKRNLIFLCQRKQISLNSLKKATNISNLSRIVNGQIQEKNLTLLTAIKLCCFFNISLDTFVNQDIKNLNQCVISSDFEYIIPKIYVKHNFKYLYESVHVTKYNIFKHTSIRSHILLKILNGNVNEKNLTIETVVRLANYFKVPLDDFVFKDLAEENKIVAICHTERRCMNEERN